MIQEDVIFIKHKGLSIVKKNNSKLIYIKSKRIKFHTYLLILKK